MGTTVKADGGAKIDFKKRLSPLYSASAKRIDDVDVPSMQFLMIEGSGDPNSSAAYAEAIEALFAVSYAIKFRVKKAEGGVDYGVMPLEGLWWADDMRAFTLGDRANWRWTVMIMQPAFVTPALVDEGIAAKRSALAQTALALLKFEEWREGRCAQLLHIGPFADEGPAIAKLHAHIKAAGRSLKGKHHEVYLSDTRRADPAKWRTILRQPYA